MTEIEKTIEDIQKQFKGIGIDYTNGKDMTAVCILGDKAEIVIEALHEKLERSKGCPACDGKYADERVSDRYCNCCGRRLEVEHETD